MSKHFKEYKNEFIKKLRSLKNSDPRVYWNLLNKADRRSSSTIKNVSLDAFADHFKKLYMVDTENDKLIPEVDPLKVSEFNLELNAQITEQEVLKSINNLKLNKACASDLILNEFLKFSKHKMLVVFTKLFNLVFTSGIIPDEWSQGIISPIYIRTKVIRPVLIITEE